MPEIGQPLAHAKAQLTESLPEIGPTHRRGPPGRRPVTERGPKSASASGAG